MTTIEDLKIIQIPKIHDPRGNLSVIEGDVLPYRIERVYYLYDVPSDAARGGHWCGVASTQADPRVASVGLSLIRD